MRHLVTPRGFYENYIAELQQTLLKHDQYIPELKNEDPNDLARTAKVTASSTTRFEPFGRNDVVPPKRETFVRFPIDRTISAPLVWVWLEPAEGISQRLMGKAPTGACRACGGRAGQKWTVVPTQYYSIAVEPPIAIATDYAPENVIHGAARIVGKSSNIWQSGAQQPLPQWIALEFPQPTQFNTVYLTFDTELNNSRHNVAFPRECVRDYELSDYDGKRWGTLARITGNDQRRHVHRFDSVTASRLNLTVHRTSGHPGARVFETRVYDEPEDAR